MPYRGQPAEKLCAGGNNDHQGSGGKKTFAHLGEASGEHVMNPYAKTEEASGKNGNNHGCVTENVTTAEDRHDGRHDCRARQENDVHLRMAKEPK